MYKGGRGVPQNYAMAYAWFNVAAAGGAQGSGPLEISDERARTNRDIIKKEMTPSQIQIGQSLAMEIFNRIQKREEAAEAE